MDVSRSHSAHDRLSALRQPAPTTAGGARWPVGALVVVAVLVLGVAVVAWNLRADSAQVVTASTSMTETSVVSENVLLTGEALIAVAAERGTFPPQLDIGDTVRIVVVPRFTGEVNPEVFTDVAIVHDVSAPTDIASSFVITLRAAESVAPAVADAESVHLSIVADSLS